MNNIDCVIENLIDLHKHYTVRDGFVFTSITEPANVYDALVLRYPEMCDCHTPKVGFSTRTLQECIDLINQYNIKKVLIIAENIEFLQFCPSLECLEIVPSDTAEDAFDYSPLYELKKITELNCKTVYGNIGQFSTNIDYSKVKGLKKVTICDDGHMNYSDVFTLESLSLSNVPQLIDLQNLTSLCNLNSLDIVNCGIQSLSGIEELTKLRQLNLGYCRKLNDVSDLIYICCNLNQLSIENCNKIKDFNFLYQMIGLVRLHLEGKNNLEDLYFLKQMANLRELFMWMNVLNGDITPCVGIPYVSIANRKHYNMKNIDLPKLK